MSVPLPAAFGKYQLLSHIACGGMADVYLGRLSGPGGFEKRLVVKVIRPELAQRREFCELFVAEAKITVSLTHANIVPVYELGMVEGQYYLAMELVDGPTLHHLVFDPRPERGGPIPAPLSAYIAEQVLRGLDYAHRQGVVHCDLSPANVMCSRDGEVKILDFGIAAQIHSARVLGGSAGYTAPESAKEAGGVLTARSDLYCAGVILAEAATGQRFAQARDQVQKLPAALRRAIETATALRPEDRYPSAEAMLGELSRYLRDADPPTQSDLSRLVRRRAPDERPARPHGPPRPSTRMAIVPLTPAPGVPQTRPLQTIPPARDVTAPREDATPSIRALSELLAAGAVPDDAPEDTPGPSPPPRTPTAPLAPAARVPEIPPPRTPLVDLPPAGGTVTFASRPARVHATWRTYAGAVTLLLVALGGWQVVRLLRPPPLPPADETPALPANQGKLRIELPRGARLLVDGKDADPEGAIVVPAGRHRIEASATGRRSVSQLVEVPARETVRERLQLPWLMGQLHLSSTPDRADVLLDGEAAGTTPLDLDVPLDRPVTLRLGHKGYGTAVREVLPSQWAATSAEARLGRGADPEEGAHPPELRLHVALEELGRGLLTIGAMPWAQVFVDGERRGDTPLRRLPLTAGSHTLRLLCPPQSCQEAREFRQNLTIEPGRELRRIVDFRQRPPAVNDK